jgi:hypothetical protein
MQPQLKRNPYADPARMIEHTMQQVANIVIASEMLKPQQKFIHEKACILLGPKV